MTNDGSKYAAISPYEAFAITRDESLLSEEQSLALRSLSVGATISRELSGQLQLIPDLEQQLLTALEHRSWDVAKRKGLKLLNAEDKINLSNLHAEFKKTLGDTLLTPELVSLLGVTPTFYETIPEASLLKSKPLPLKQPKCATKLPMRVLKPLAILAGVGIISTGSFWAYQTIPAKLHQRTVRLEARATMEEKSFFAAAERSFVTDANTFMRGLDAYLSLNRAERKGGSGPFTYKYNAIPLPQLPGFRNAEPRVLESTRQQLLFGIGDHLKVGFQRSDAKFYIYHSEVPHQGSFVYCSERDFFTEPNFIRCDVSITDELQQKFPGLYFLLEVENPRTQDVTQESVKNTFSVGPGALYDRQIAENTRLRIGKKFETIVKRTVGEETTERKFEHNISAAVNLGEFVYSTFPIARYGPNRISLDSHGSTPFNFK